VTDKFTTPGFADYFTNAMRAFKYISRHGVSDHRFHRDQEISQKEIQEKSERRQQAHLSASSDV